MIDINNIPEQKALKHLDEYRGSNNFILKLKEKFLKNKKFYPTRTQADYIINYESVDPKVAKKWVDLDIYFAKKIANDKAYIQIPEKIYVEKLLVEKDTSYHIWGKFFENEEITDIWLPKAAIIKTNNTKVEVDYEKYNQRPPLEHQKIAIETLLRNEKFILADDMGAGKGLTYNALIYTDLGVKKIGDVKVNDKIIGSDGKPYKVTGVFPQGKKETYKVTFNDGYSILTDDNHLWSVSSPNYGKNTKNERIKKSLVLSTKQMYEGGKITIKGNGKNTEKTYTIETYFKSPNGNNKWQIPIVNPIIFQNKTILPIKPYLFGLALGDGHFNKKNIRFAVHKDDFDELFTGHNIKENKPRNNLRNGYIKVDNVLYELKLENARSHNKFIPEIYKYSSIENRLALLQGLMDTDGHCMLSKNGKFRGTEFSTTSEKLCDDVCEIVQTLGGIARKRPRRSFYKKNGKKIECNISYRVNIKLKPGMNPFKLKRKADRYNEPKKYPTGRYITNIEKFGEEECICISVNSPDKLYVTEHAIVTHNTTSATIAALESKSEKILIICPASLKINWERELKLYTDKTISIIEGKEWKDADIIIVNYDILKNFHEIDSENSKILESKFDLIIIDECHFLGNSQAQRTKIVNDFAKKIKKIWLLTGTPITSRPINYYNLLKIIECPIADNWMAYVKRYCNGFQFKAGNRKIWNVSGASNLEELRDRTSKYILRRLKEDILDLPDKIITPIYLRLKSKEYEKVMGEYYEWRNNKENKNSSLAVQFTKLMKVRQLIALEKVQSTIDFCEDIVEQGKKVIIFTNFTDSLNRIYEHFGKKAVKLDGSMSKVQRQESVDRFQDDEKIMIFVGNIKAAGVGITLTSAEVVVMNDLSFVPADHAQAEDRAYRYGQKSNVLVYYPLFENTIEGKIYDILNRKKQIIRTVMGDGVTETDSTEEILSFINNSR